jgi:hypothetical protein
MTAGLPGTHHPGSTLHRRTLAAIIAMSIAVAPAHAYGGVSLAMDTTPVSAALELAGGAPETSGDVSTEASPESGAGTAPPGPEVTVSPDLSAGDQSSTPPIDQVIYKGVVGNILEAMPLDPEQRVHLQRGNAVVNNTFTGRTLALLLGIASPPLMIVGLIWGIWSAANIKPAQVEPAAAATPVRQPEVQAEQTAAVAQSPDVSSTNAGAVSDSARVAAQGGE